MELIGTYKNGNYTVSIYDDGTKIRENDLDFFKADSPEAFDIKLTNCCNMGCFWCHENSTPDGIHGDIMNLKFIETLHPYTELAIGGGNPLSHPDLIPFLQKCKSLNLIPSMTVNQIHFMKDLETIKYLIDNKLIYGLGVSLVAPTSEFISEVEKFPNAVIHVIAGIVSLEELRILAHKDLKILILGYKQFRRGETFYEKIGPKIEEKINIIKHYLKPITNWFKVVSFDNLAIKQLEPSRILSKEEYDEFYMGNDGEFTMYIDCVNKTYSVSSTSPLDQRYPIKDDIKEMFNHLKEEK